MADVLRVVSAADVCDAVEVSLRAHVLRVLVAMGLPTGRERGAFKVPGTWRQVPRAADLLKADVVFPAGSLTSPGTVGEPVRTARGYHATFRVEVGVADRGPGWNETADRTRRWAAVLRAACLVDPSLGGLADGVVWRAEDYARHPDPNVGRTLGMASVTVDVLVPLALPFVALPPLVEADESLGVVEVTAPSVSVQSIS